MLKISLPYIVESLTYIFNLSISQNKFPTQLKQAKVIPLPKAKNLSDINNYRPISLLSVLSKLLERHVHTHLTSYMETRDLFHPFQSGFRSKHSCVTTLSCLSDRWLSAINSAQLSGVVFLDLAKAFDTIDHQILLSKLKIYLGDSCHLDFFQSYLQARTQYVSVNGLLSSVGLISHGVPQGSVLGPLLFCVYINDLPLHVTDTSVECHMLADDTTINKSSPHMQSIQTSLQNTLTDISHWCALNRMNLNPTKTKSMVLTTRQKHQLRPLTLSLSINNSNIEQVHQHRVLGVIIDDSLQWKQHVEHLCKLLSRNLYLLSRLQSILPTEAKKVFYSAHIKSHLDYASVVWDGCSGALFKEINSRHRRAVRLVSPLQGVSTDSKMADLGLLPLHMHLLFNKAVFMFKVLNDYAPSYLTDLFHSAPSPYSYFKYNLIYPRPRLDIYKTSISFSGAQLWNTLPTTLKIQTSLSSFKTALHRHFLSTDYKR